MRIFFGLHSAASDLTVAVICRWSLCVCFPFSAIAEQASRCRSARNMAARVALYERLLSQILPNQPPNVQREIRSSLAEVSECLLSG